jgi:hypothetical protein
MATPSHNPVSKTILALDPGRDVGVCLGAVGGRPVTSTWILPFDQNCPEVLGNTLSDFEFLLGEKLPRDRKGSDTFEVIVEAAWIPRSFVDVNALKLLLGLIGIAEKLCYDRSIVFRETNIQSYRSTLLGRTKGVDKKDILQAVKAFGLSPKNLHESDAAAVWLERAFFHDRSLRQSMSIFPQSALPSAHQSNLN